MLRLVPAPAALWVCLAACHSSEPKHEEIDETTASITLPATWHEVADELARVQREDEPSAVRPDFGSWECVYMPPPSATCDAIVPSLWRAPDGAHWVVELGGIHGRGRHCYGPYWLVEDRLLPLRR